MPALHLQRGSFSAACEAAPFQNEFKLTQYRQCQWHLVEIALAEKTLAGFFLEREFQREGRLANRAGMAWQINYVIESQGVA